MRFRAFAESILTAVVTFANTLQASQKIISILAKFAYALHALRIKTVRNGGKGKIFKNDKKYYNMCYFSGRMLHACIHDARTTFIKVESWQGLKATNKHT